MADVTLASVFVHKEGRYCLVQETGQKYSGKPEIYMKWGPPTEKVEEGEAPLAAAYRAMKEEAGVAGVIKSAPVLDRKQKRGGTRTNRLYFAEFAGYAPRPGDHPLMWLTAEEMRGNPEVIGHVMGMMEKLGLIS